MPADLVDRLNRNRSSRRCARPRSWSNASQPGSGTGRQFPPAEFAAYMHARGGPVGADSEGGEYQDGGDRICGVQQMASEPKRLRTLLGDHPGTAALKSGQLVSDHVALDFADYSPTNKASSRWWEGAFDAFPEMAIVAYLMAKDLGQADGAFARGGDGSFPHAQSLDNAEQGELSPPRSARQARRHSLVHHHHRGVGARDPLPTTTASISMASTG